MAKLRSILVFFTDSSVHDDAARNMLFRQCLEMLHSRIPHVIVRNEMPEILTAHVQLPEADIPLLDGFLKDNNRGTWEFDEKAIFVRAGFR